MNNHDEHIPDFARVAAENVDPETKLANYRRELALYREVEDMVRRLTRMRTIDVGIADQQMKYALGNAYVEIERREAGIAEIESKIEAQKAG